MNIQTIKVGNRDAVVLVPESAGQLAVVDLNVIKRLASTLPSVPLSHIKQRIVDTIDRANTLELLIQELEAEVAFHRSVNLITEYTEYVPDPETVEKMRPTYSAD